MCIHLCSFCSSIWTCCLRSVVSSCIQIYWSSSCFNDTLDTRWISEMCKVKEKMKNISLIKSMLLNLNYSIVSISIMYFNHSLPSIRYFIAYIDLQKVIYPRINLIHGSYLDFSGPVVVFLRTAHLVLNVGQNYTAI